MADERGYWGKDPKSGHRQWFGPYSRKEKHGPATIDVDCDKYSSVDGCRLPDGTRGLVRHSFASNVERDGQKLVWRTQRPDGGYEYGRIEVDEGVDVRFVAEPELAPKPAPDHPVYDRFVIEVRSDPRLMALLRDIEFAREFYAAMCNMDWVKTDASSAFGCTFRTAGRIVAELRGIGEEYIDFYGSGPEGTVSPRVAAELSRLQWSAREMIGPLY
ncbi:MAG: hypothetical protein AAF799_25130 [Myxococcota bacterium]